MNNQRKLSDDLRNWAVSEMHFYPDNQKSPLQVEDFGLLCRGQVVDIWKFVTDHVYSAQTVKKVKGNLKVRRYQQLASKKQTDDFPTNETAMLRERKHKIRAEMRSVMTDISQLEKDLARQQEEGNKTNTQYQSSVSDITDIKCKETILKTFSNQSDNLITQYEEYIKRIDGKLKQFSNTLGINDECMLESQKDVGETNNNKNTDAFETPCSQNTRETCQYIHTYLKEILNGSFGESRGSENVKTRKQRVWSRVEKLLSEYPLGGIIQSLTANTHKSSLSLADKTLKINIRNDASSLRFKFESAGVLKDLSIDPSLLQSVHQLIEEGQNRHVQKFIETEKLLNQAYNNQKHLEHIKESISSSLKDLYNGNPGDYQMALSLADSKLTLSVEKATLNCLLSEAEKLRQSIANGVKDKELLYTKYQEIHDFQSVAAKKLNLITELVKQNSNARKKLNFQKIDIDKYITSSLSIHYVEANTLVSQLSGCTAAEVDKFAQLTMPYLAFLWLDDSNKCAIVDFSIDTTDLSRYTQTMKHLESLKFPPWKAPENVLSHCLQIKDDITNAQIIKFTDDEKLEITKRIVGLCKRVDQDDNEQIERTLPNLQERLKQSTGYLNKCSKVNNDISIWWDQPAFFLVPWVKVDGYSAQQWKDKWTVLSAQMQQMA